MTKDSLGLLVKKVELKSDKIANHLLQECGLSASQFRVLRWLFKHENTVPRQTDLEKALAMTNPTVTGILNNLEKNGWVKRLAHPEDKRSKQVVLTDKACRRQEDLYELSKSMEVDLVKNLSEAERQILRELLQKILEEK